MYGKKVRLSKIFRDDGKTLIVALDHGMAFGPLPGMTDPLDVIGKVLKGNPDALLLSPGLLRLSAGSLGKVSAIMSINCGLKDYNSIVREALRLGADAIKLMVFTHGPDEAENLKSLYELSIACEEWGLPLLAEMYPRTKDRCKGEVIAKVARIAAEAGADFVKTFYTGDKKSFKKVVDACPVPVIILGGPKIESDEEMFNMVRDALDAGARGVAFGRNIWQRRNPGAMVKKLAELIHEES